MKTMRWIQCQSAVSGWIRYISSGVSRHRAPYSAEIEHLVLITSTQTDGDHGNDNVDDSGDGQEDNNDDKDNDGDDLDDNDASNDCGNPANIFVQEV